MTIYGHNGFPQIKAEFFSRRIDDANIGLVGNQPIHLINRHARYVQHFFADIRQRFDGNFEYRRAIHAQKWVTGRLAAVHLARHT